MKRCTPTKLHEKHCIAVTEDIKCLCSTRHLISCKSKDLLQKLKKSFPMQTEFVFIARQKSLYERSEAGISGSNRRICAADAGRTREIFLGDDKCPSSTISWRSNYPQICAYFKYPAEIHKIIYTTNSIENFNRQLRKVTKTRSIFPDMD